MWHEARKQERRIRGMIVDYRKRAERRQDFYEKIQADPTQFIQVHGRRCKIHLDPAVATAGDGAAIIVPWQGQQDNLIDRFDVRAHLDYIPPLTKDNDEYAAEQSQEERQCNYERYRILAQNDFLNVPEEKFLHQLYLEEQYGANAQLEAERNLGKKKQQQKSGATIGYIYEESDSCLGPQPFSHLMSASLVGGTSGAGTSKSEKGSDSESDSDMDMDVAIDISKLDTAQAHELNGCGRNYGMVSNDFYSYLTKDVDEADALRIAREEEQEKMLLSGRKSRRERRAQKERRIACRPYSPPSYAAKEDAAGKKDKADEESDSRSPSPDANAGKITYITYFGGEDELQPHSKISINLSKGAQTLGESCVGAIAAAASAASGGPVTYAQKVKENLERLKQLNETSKRSRHVTTSCSRSQRSGRDRQRHSGSYSRSRSRSYDSRHRQRGRRSRSYESTKARKRHRRSGSRSHSHSRTMRRRRHHYHSSVSRSRSSFTSDSHTESSSSSRGVRRRKLRRRTTSSKSPLRHRSRSFAKKHVLPTTPPQGVAAPKVTAIKMKTNDCVTTTLTAQPVMISYPLPARIIATTTTTTITSSTSKPSVAPTLSRLTAVVPPPLPSPKMVTTTTVKAALLPQVFEPPPPPLKRYYGRKRGDDSDDESVSSTASHGSVASAAEKQVRRSTTVNYNDDSDDHLDVLDTASERSNPLSLTATSATAMAAPSKSTVKQSGKFPTGQAKYPSYPNATEAKATTTMSASPSGCLNLRERLKRKMQNLLNKQYKADKRAEVEKSERERQLQQEREDEMRELALKLRRRQRELRHKYGTPSSDKLSDSDIDSQLPAVKIAGGVLQRSKTHSSERSASPLSQQQQRDEPRSRQYCRSTSRDHRRSRSHSYHHGSKQQRRSRSRSRNRRSVSRRRRRSASRQQQRMRGRPEYEQERHVQARHRHYDDRYRRSRSRERGGGNSYRKPQRLRERGDPRSYMEGGARERDQAVPSGSRNRVVISAPPKLKKLVDY